MGVLWQKLLVYVDDILLAGNDKDMLNNIKVELNNKFEMKDMGEDIYSRNPDNKG